MPAHNLVADAPKVPVISISRDKESGTGGLRGGTGLGRSSLGMKSCQECGENSVPPSPFFSPPLSAVLELQGDSPSWQAQKGQFLRLLCAADSRPPATLIWALEDRALSQSHPSGSGGLELVLPGVQPGDAGRYSCRAENRLGFQSRTLKLSVNCECDKRGLVSRRQEGEGAGTADTVPEF